ncbi:hypothetical protein D1647_03270 [Alistipes sp. Z76]|nr:hypothetical protein [Alistipes sp. Z76]
MCFFEDYRLRKGAVRRRRRTQTSVKRVAVRRSGAAANCAVRRTAEFTSVSFNRGRNIFDKPRAEPNKFGLCRGEKMTAQANYFGRRAVAVKADACIFAVRRTARAAASARGGPLFAFAHCASPAGRGPNIDAFS